MSLINAFNNVTEQSLVLTKEYLEVTPSLSSVGIYGWSEKKDDKSYDEGEDDTPYHKGEDNPAYDKGENDSHYKDEGNPIKHSDKGNTVWHSDEGNTVKIQFVNDRGVKYDFSYHICKIESATKCYGYVTSWAVDVTNKLDHKYYNSWAYHIEQTISNLKEFTFVSNNYEKLCFTSYNDEYLPEYDGSNGYAYGFDDRKIPQFTAYNRNTYVQSLTNEDIKNGFVVIKL